MQRVRELGINGGFACVATLFLAWGFISSNNDPLIVALRAAFGLSYSSGLMIQQVNFLANGLISLPAASLSNRIGAVNTILVALAVMTAGTLLLCLSIEIQSFYAVLLAMFVVGVGITSLQVSANPLAATLGPQSSSHFRLNFAQAFNSLGVVVGVHFGASVMLGERVVVERQGSITNPIERAEALSAVSHAYLAMAALLVLLAVFIWTQRHRIEAAGLRQQSGKGSVFDAMRSRWALFGSVAIALYVGAEVSIGSIMINFLHQSDVMGVDFESGGRYLANIYWGGALVGRILGSIMLTRFQASRLLLTVACAACGLCLFVTIGEGRAIGFAALAVGLFNSIMFPTIFSITLERSGASQSSTSGLLSLAILGGVLLTIGVGWLADLAGLQTSFVLPALAYTFIALFAAKAAGKNEAASFRKSAASK